MATTRVPPSHAPAYGRRRQMGGPGGAQGPGRGNGPPDHAPAHGRRRKTGEVNETQRTRGAGATQDVRNAPPARAPNAAAVPTNLPPASTNPANTNLPASGPQPSLIDRIQDAATAILLNAQDKDAERLRQRRLTEEEARMLKSERMERDAIEQRRIRETIHKPHEDKQRGQTDSFRTQENRLDVDAAGRQGLRRALSAIERASDFLVRGQGSEAQLVLSNEAARAKREARALGRGDLDGRTLGAVAANMAARAEALGTTVPAEAQKWAERIDRVAQATDSRARTLEGQGRSTDARLLGSIATDSRAQAALIAAGAANSEALLGRGLAQAVQRITDAAVAASLPPKEVTNPRAQMPRAEATNPRAQMPSRPEQTNPRAQMPRAEATNPRAQMPRAEATNPRAQVPRGPETTQPRAVMPGSETTQPGALLPRRLETTEPRAQMPRAPEASAPSQSAWQTRPPPPDVPPVASSIATPAQAPAPARPRTPAPVDPLRSPPRAPTPSFPLDRSSLAQAFAALDRALIAERRPLHELLDPARLADKDPARLQKLAMSVGFNRPEVAAAFLIEHPFLKNLLPPLLDLSRAFSAGDAQAVNLARSAIVKELHRNQQLPLLQQMLAQQGLPTMPTQSADEFVQRGLPLLFLRGLLAGGLGSLAKDSGSMSLAGWLKKLAPPEMPPAQLLPAEKIISDLIRGRIDPAPAAASEIQKSRTHAWSPTALGAHDALLLGTQSLFNAAGVVTQFLRANPIPLKELSSPAQFVPSDAISARLTALPSAGPHELAVLVDTRGAVMVRTPDGPSFHQGFITAAEGRTYFDVHGFDGGLTRVAFQPAADPERVLTRLDLEVDPGSGGGSVRTKSREADAVGPETPVIVPWIAAQGVPAEDAPIEEVTDEPRTRRRVLRRPSEDLAAIVLDTEGDHHGAFLGLVAREAAERFAEQLADATARLEDGPHLEGVLIDVSTDCGAALTERGRARGHELQADLADRLVELGLSPNKVAALILIADEDAARVILGGPEAADGTAPEDLPPGALVAFDGQSAVRCELPPDRVRAPDLAKEGVLLVPATGVIID